MNLKFNVIDFVKKIKPLDLNQKIPKSEYQERVERLKNELMGKGIDVGFAFGNELRPGDTGWLTGYDPQIEPTAVVIGKEKMLILGGPEGEAYAKEMMMAGEFRNVLEFKIPEEDYPGYEFMSLKDILKEACGYEPNTIGLLTLPSILPLEIFRLIEQNCTGKIIDSSDILLNFRYFKSPLEIKMMGVAGQISSRALEAMIAGIEPGLRELEVAALAEYTMKSLGADRVGVSTIACSGYRAPNVIGRASNKVIQDGDMIVLTVSARYDGLASCVGRTLVVGNARPAQKEFIDQAIAAYEMGIKNIGFNKPANMVDKTVRGILDPKGLSPLYSVVHGIGWTEAMEGKGAATQYSTWNFPKGIAFMVDLGIFGRSYKDLSGAGIGLRIEDPYAIDHEGNVLRLTDLPLRCEAGQTYSIKQ